MYLKRDKRIGQKKKKKKSYRFFPRQHTVTYFYFKYFK